MFLITFALISCSSSNESKSPNKVKLSNKTPSNKHTSFLEEFDGVKASSWLNEHNLSHSWSEKKIEIKQSHYFGIFGMNLQIIALTFDVKNLVVINFYRFIPRFNKGIIGLLAWVVLPNG